MKNLLQLIAPLAVMMVAVGVMLGPIGFTATPDAGGEVTRQLVEWRWFLALEGVVGIVLLFALRHAAKEN